PGCLRGTHSLLRRWASFVLSYLDETPGRRAAKEGVERRDVGPRVGQVKIADGSRLTELLGEALSHQSVLIGTGHGDDLLRLGVARPTPLDHERTIIGTW